MSAVIVFLCMCILVALNYLSARGSVTKLLPFSPPFPLSIPLSFFLFVFLSPNNLLYRCFVVVARECTVCGSEPAQFECKMCYQKGVVADRAGMPSYCGGCNGKIHGHRDRQHHKTRPVILPRQFKNERWMLDKQKMELFAVVCIETSHYVAFVKCGDGVDKSWCFFDSMADRKGNVFRSVM